MDKEQKKLIDKLIEVEKEIEYYQYYIDYCKFQQQMGGYVKEVLLQKLADYENYKEKYVNKKQELINYLAEHYNIIF